VYSLLGAINPKKVSKGGSKSKAIELMKADQQVLLRRPVQRMAMVS